MKMDEDMFVRLEKLVSNRKGREGTKKGRERVREILQFLMTYPGSTPYQISKVLYGRGTPAGARKGMSVLTHHLGKLEKIYGLIKTKEKRTEKRVVRHLYLTKAGKSCCKKLGVLPPSPRAAEVVSTLRKLTKDSLNEDEAWKLEMLLTDDVIKSIEEIVYNQLNKLQLHLPGGPKPMIKIEPEWSPEEFITAMAVLDFEIEYKDLIDRRIPQQVDQLKARVKEEIAAGKPTAIKDALHEYAYRIISNVLDPNFYTWANFEKISCAYYLLKKEEIVKNLLELRKWFREWFWCSYHIVRVYVGSVRSHLRDNMFRYAECWASYDYLHSMVDKNWVYSFWDKLSPQLEEISPGKKPKKGR